MSNYKFEINGIFNDQISKGIASLNRALKLFATRADAAATSAQKMKDAGLKLDQMYVKTYKSADNTARKTGDLGRTFRGATTDSNRMSYGLHQLATALNNIMGGSSGLMTSLINLKTLGMAATAVAAIYLGKALVGVGKYAYDNATAIDALNMKMKASIGTYGDYGKEVEFLKDVSNEMGLDFRKLSSEYASFAASSLRSGLSLEQTRQIFIDIMKAGVAMKLTNEQLAFSMQAITQISSKGVVSMEELRRQLGDHLPGALQIAAKSMGMANDEFIKLVESGKLVSKDFLPRFANEVKKELGGSFEDAANSMQANGARLSNAFKEMGASFSSKTYGDLNATIRSLAAVTLEYGVPVIKELGRTFNLLIKPVQGAVWSLDILAKKIKDPTRSWADISREVVYGKSVLDKSNEAVYKAAGNFDNLANSTDKALKKYKMIGLEIENSKKVTENSFSAFDKLVDNLSSPKELAISKFNKEIIEAKKALEDFNIYQDNVKSSKNIVEHYTKVLANLTNEKKKLEAAMAIESSPLTPVFNESSKRNLEFYNSAIETVATELGKYNAILEANKKAEEEGATSKIKNTNQVLAKSKEMLALDLELLGLEKEKYLFSTKDQDLMTSQIKKVELDKKEVDILARKKTLTGEINKEELDAIKKRLNPDAGTIAGSIGGYKNKEEREIIENFKVKISSVDIDIRNVEKDLKDELSKLEIKPEFEGSFEAYKRSKTYEIELAKKNIREEEQESKLSLDKKIEDFKKYAKEKYILQKNSESEKMSKDSENSAMAKYAKEIAYIMDVEQAYTYNIVKKREKQEKDLADKNKSVWERYFSWIKGETGKSFMVAAEKASEYLSFVNEKISQTADWISGINDNLTNVAQNYYQSHYDSAMKELEKYKDAQETAMDEYDERIEAQGEKIEELREIESRAGRRAKKIIQAEIKEEERVNKQAEKEKNRLAKETEAEEKRRSKDAEARRRKEMVAYKVLAISGALIDTYQAANAAYASLAGIKRVGPALGITAAAAAVAGGLANVDQIRRQEFAKGGFPQGKNAVIQVNERGQEAVLNAQAVRNIGIQGVNNLNAGKMVGNTSVSIGGPVINVYGTPTQTDLNHITTSVREENDRLARQIERMIQTKQINPDIIRKSIK